MGRLDRFLETQASFFNWIYNPLKMIVRPFTTVVYPCFYGGLFYLLGYTIKMFPSVELALNNGFYIMGVDSMFKFPEFFGTLAFVVSMVGSILSKTMSLMQPKRKEEANIIYPDNLKPEELYKPKVNLFDLDGNLTLLSFPQEKVISKAGIDSLSNLEQADVKDIQRILQIAPTLAQQIIDEAKEVMNGFRSKGLI